MSKSVSQASKQKLKFYSQLSNFVLDFSTLSQVGVSRGFLCDSFSDHMASAKWKFWSLTAAELRIVEHRQNNQEVQKHTKVPVPEAVMRSRFLR